MDKNPDTVSVKNLTMDRNHNQAELCRCSRPNDTAGNREMVVSHVLKDIERNEGALPKNYAFIEKT